MPLSQMLLPEFDHEMANTRRTLERIPGDALGWRPHPKSMSLVQLATHLARLPDWGRIVLTTREFEITSYKPATPGSREEILDVFDGYVAPAREALAAATDEAMGEKWSLLRGGETIFRLPRRVALRGFVLSHGVHHRGQLTVYLRLNDVPVPALYGPSADEQ